MTRRDRRIRSLRHGLLAVGTMLVAVAGSLALAGCRSVGGMDGAGGAALPVPAAPVRGIDAPWRVGIQIGHLDGADAPDELSHLRSSTGAYAAGVAEVEVNRDIAARAAALLEQHGIEVVLLPATVPPRFTADAFVALHADGNPSSAPRGFKVAPPWRASPTSRRLVAALHTHYGRATGLPHDLNGVSFNMRGYYAFSGFRYRHSIAFTTPAAILEMGYVTNPEDRAFLLAHPDVAAAGIAAGVRAFLAERNPLDPIALYPPDPVLLLPVRRDLPVYAARDPAAAVRVRLKPTDFVVGLDLVDGWYDVRVRGSYRSFGWVRQEHLVRLR